MSNNENMDSYTVLHTSYLCFTFGTNLMHASPRADTIPVFLPAFFNKFKLFEFQVKDTAGTIDHAQIASSSMSPVEAYTCRSNLTSSRIIWIC